MATVAWVRAVRGRENDVCEDHEELLSQIFDFFEHLRLKGQNKEFLAGSKVVEIPREGSVKDWFVPCSAEIHHGRYAWLLSKDEERLVHSYCANLCRMGIPSFLWEQHKRDLMKLFIPLEAYVKEDALPPMIPESTRDRIWKDLKKNFVEFVLKIASAIVFRFYKNSPQLVAVFDSCGYSPAVDRWKISFRLCFIDIAITLDRLVDISNVMVAGLDSAWAGLEEQAWKFMIEPKQRPASSADSQRSFWASILDERAFKTGAQHQLVFCDTSVEQGDAAIDTEGASRLPEGRPLLPYGLFRCTSSGNVNDITINCISGTACESDCEDAIDACDWASYGSVWTNESKTTPFAKDILAIKCNSTAAKVEIKQGSAPKSEIKQGSRGNPTLGGKATAVPPWLEYKRDGKTFYFNPDTKVSQWDLPRLTPKPLPLQQYPPEHQWEVCEGSNGEKFFRNKVSNESVWELPAGAKLLPGTLTTVR